MRLGRVSVLLAAAAPSVGSLPAHSAEKIDFILNWAAGGDHAPVYHAQAQGLYKKAGLNVTIRRGKGSTMSAQRVGAGKNQLGIADLGAALVAKGGGADVVAVMNIYANSPHGMYWKKSSGIKGVKDFAGKTIGNPPGDSARQMWPAFAKAVGIDPKSVRWVDVGSNARIAALRSGAIDVTTAFYNTHFVFQRVFKEDLGFLLWRDQGINPYGNSIVVNGEYLKENPKAVESFVRVTQKAYADCAAKPTPCIESLIKSNKKLKTANEMARWLLVRELMDDKVARSVALGYFDPARMKSDYKLFETYFGMKKAFDIESAYSNKFLNRAVKLKN